MIQAAVIGYGYWGRNVARALHNSTEFALHTIYDEDQTAQAKAKEDYEITTYINYEAILANSEFQAIFIITPPQTHLTLRRIFIKTSQTHLCRKAPNHAIHTSTTALCPS